MKKNRLLSALLTVVLLLSLLTACQTLPDNDQTPASTPSSNRTVLPPPIYTTAAPSSTTNVPSTTPPIVPPVTDPINPHTPKYEGYTFVYHGTRPSYIPATIDLSDCVQGYYYWLDEDGTEVIPIIEEEIAPCYNEYWGFSSGYVYYNEDGWVYYVKTAEPTKIYRTCRADFSQHELIYESEEGPIVDVLVYPWLENYLQFTVGNKKFIALDLYTKEEIVLMEMYYIFEASVGPGKDGEIFSNAISWSGKPTEDGHNFDYIYFRDTGELWEDPL